jgi:hypothetical protein
MGLRFNPAPGWPDAPEGFVPVPGWEPDPSWPPAPPGWELLVDDGQPDPPAGEPPPARRSGWAIASFVCGLLGFTGVGLILGVIFGILALRKIRQSRLAGRGLAVAGLCLSALWAAAYLLLWFGLATGAGTQSGVGNSGVSVFSLGTGQCFDNPAGASQVTSVDVLPCTKPHNSQVFAEFKLHGSSDFSYPGQSTVERLATAGCNDRIGSSLDRAKLNNSIRIRMIFPVTGSWLLGHRTVVCFVVSPSSNLTSSVLKAPAATG